MRMLLMTVFFTLMHAFAPAWHNAIDQGFAAESLLGSLLFLIVTIITFPFSIVSNWLWPLLGDFNWFVGYVMAWIVNKQIEHYYLGPEVVRAT